jgi:hypothetical protein
MINMIGKLNNHFFEPRESFDFFIFLSNRFAFYNINRSEILEDSKERARFKEEEL